eukprot:TRINITY_DN6720_c0_g1_i4.p1 TRINITY_DN6720_c0_g1~~TRINITY_DN6720_c0_g1_i4.p1  ORF type:complete len:263 (-),score=31.24 TRINITY_DN6720_c0_g1_i4:567-1355(-)
MTFQHERLSERVWKVVEDDPYGQFPFLYVIVGDDRCILIDTGCGRGNYLSFVDENVNVKKLPFLIVCTHVHFDHVGGNNLLGGSPRCLGICMGSANKTFTNNCDINSLCMAHNTSVKPFSVTRWLEEGDRIFLSKDEKEKDSLEVIFTPGHTPDSIALFAHWEQRLFVGDTIYPYTAIHLDSIGSSLVSYIETMKKLIGFIEKQPSTEKGIDITSLSKAVTDTGSNVPSQTQEFLALLGLELDSVNFDVEALLALCDGFFSF